MTTIADKISIAFDAFVEARYTQFHDICHELEAEGISPRFSINGGDPRLERLCPFLRHTPISIVLSNLVWPMNYLLTAQARAEVDRAIAHLEWPDWYSASAFETAYRDELETLWVGGVRVGAAWVSDPVGEGSDWEPDA